MALSKESIHGVWGSRWVFILAATGSAVGLGNIWKFPYIVGENGGGAFVLIYLLCIAVVGIPIMMGEVLIGRRGRQSPINALRSLAAEANASPLWKYVGWMGVIAGFLILSYYSVIAGWAIMYVFRLGLGRFEGATPEAVEESFNSLLADPVTLGMLHTVFLIATMVIVGRGVNQGIEVAVKVLMPALFVLLAVLLGYSISAGDFNKGFQFLFHVDFSVVTAESVLTALGHAFFTLSLGMGAIMVYGAYMPKNASIGSTVVTVALLDTLVALVAGLAIFPIVFANNMEPGAGPGLMFVTLPIAFGQIPGGATFGALFFLLVSFAAWSSSISLIEPFVAWVVEKGWLKRPMAALVLGLMIWVLGMGTVLSFNVGKDVSFLMGKNFFDSLDYLTANIMLPLGGLLVAIFAGWIMRRTTVEKELNMHSYLLYAAWTIVIRLVSPIAVVMVLIWALFAEPIKAMLDW